MRIIFSPAKKMNVNTDLLDVQEMPEFLPQTEKIKSFNRLGYRYREDLSSATELIFERQKIPIDNEKELEGTFGI
jgi:hypothetical protein